MTERTRARLLQAAADGAITGELDALMIRGRPARPSERRLIDGRRVMAWRVADIRRIARQLPSRRGAGESEAGAS